MKRRRWFSIAVQVEAQKLTASRVVLAATALIVCGITVLSGSLAWAADTGNEQVIAQLGEIAEHAGWQRLIGIAIQITSAAGLLGFGTIAAWTVGREFTDGTINALFALPVSRAHIARAKLTVVAAWAMIVALCMPFALAVPATLLGYGLPDSEAVDGLVRLIALGVLSALLASAAAWTATLGRSLLPGIAVTIAMIASAQVAVVAGTGAWYPVAAPALWALKPGTVTALQLSLVGIVAGVFAYLTARSWARLQLDR